MRQTDEDKPPNTLTTRNKTRRGPSSAYSVYSAVHQSPSAEERHKSDRRTQRQQRTHRSAFLCLLRYLLFNCSRNQHCSCACIHRISEVYGIHGGDCPSARGSLAAPCPSLASSRDCRGMAQAAGPYLQVIVRGDHRWRGPGPADLGSRFGTHNRCTVETRSKWARTHEPRSRKNLGHPTDPPFLAVHGMGHPLADSVPHPLPSEEWGTLAIRAILS
jgi:hypothetical protein